MGGVVSLPLSRVAKPRVKGVISAGSAIWRAPGAPVGRVRRPAAWSHNPGRRTEALAHVHEDSLVCDAPALTGPASIRLWQGATAAEMDSGEVLDPGPGDGHRGEAQSGQAEDHRRSSIVPMTRHILAAATR